MSTGFGKPGRSVIRDKEKDDKLLSKMAALRQENERLREAISSFINHTHPLSLDQVSQWATLGKALGEQK